MARDLSIKVKVNLPTAGELESKLNKMLGGKDLNTNVKVNAKIGKLGDLKSQIRRAIGDEKFNARVGVKVSGMGELNRLASQIEKVRRLASEPIKMKVDTGGTGFDRQIEEARSKAKGMGDAIAKSQSSAMVAAQKEMRQAQNDMAKTYADIQRSNARAIKAKSDADEQVYRQSQAQYQARLKEQEESYRKMASGHGVDSAQIEKEIRRAQSNPKIDERVSLANNAREARAAAAAWKEYSAAIKAAYKAEEKVATKSVGSHEDKALKDSAVAYRAEAAAIKQRNTALKESPKYQRQEHQMQLRHNQQMAQIRARAADGVYDSRQPRMRTRGGIIPTMDIGGALMAGATGMASVISQLNDVDKAITKVTKVVPDSQTAVNKWKKNIYRDAAEVGKTAPEFASAVEQWATAGYNLKQSNRLAKTSVMGSFVGEVPVNDMVRYMAVPLKAFQKEGLKSTDVVNAMNEVSNKHAIEMDDLGQAYQKASSTMGATGTTFSQMTGIITAAQEGTRAGGDAIGTAFKTISANLAQIGTGLTRQAKGKDEFFNKLGVQLKDSKGNLKSTYQVMDQLSHKWKSMNKADKNTAALYAGGKNHANIFSATMDNWATARKAMLEAQEQKGLGKSGSAYQEMAKQKQSIEFQLKGLQDMWGEFIQNLSGGRKGIGEMLSLVSSLGGGLLKLSSNPLISSATRWTAVAGGILMARRALGGLTAGLGNVMLQGRKGDGLINRLAGLDAKTEKWHDTTEKFKDSWAELWGNKRSHQPVGESLSTSKSSPANGLGVKDETPMINANTVAHEKNKKAVSSSNQVRKDLEKGARQSNGVLLTEGAALEKSSAKVSSSTSKLRRFGNMAKAGFGVLGAGLGYVGLAMDAVTIAGVAMEALGIHPIKMLQKAMDPAGESAKSFGKYIDRVGQSVDRTSNAIESNGIVTGQLKADMDSISDMQKTVKGFDPSSKLDKGTFNDLEKSYNALAKHNGLELRITDDNSAGNVQQKIEALQNAIQQVKKEDIESLGEKAGKQISNVDKLLSSKNWQKLLNGNSDYLNGLDKVKAQFHKVGSHGEDLGYEPGYNKAKNRYDEEYRSGTKNAEIWNSANGRKIANQVATAQRGIRDAITGMGDAYANGTISKADLMGMSGTGRSLAGLGVIKNLRDLKGSKDNAAISKAKTNLSDVLGNLGASSKQIAKIQKAALDGNNASLLRGMKGAGLNRQLIMAMAGIGAQYQQQYRGKKYGNGIDAAAHDSAAVRTYQKHNKGHSQNADALINPNTGFVNFNKLAKFNAGAVTSNIGRAIMSASGVKKYDGPLKNTMSTDQLLNLTTGLHGDPTKILSDMVQGKASVGSVATVINNAHGVKRDEAGKVTGGGATGGQIVQGEAQSFGNNGKKLTKSQFDTGLQEAVTNGQMTQEQADRATQIHDRNFNGKGDAKTVWGAMSQWAKDAPKTIQSFKDATKGLSNKERKTAIDTAEKNGNITKKQADELRKGNWTKQKEKNGRGKTERNTDKETDDSDPKKPSKKKHKSKRSKDENDRSRASNKNAPKVKKQSVIPTDLRNLGGKGSAIYELTHSKFGNSLFGKNGWFGKMGQGFAKGGIVGGLGNMLKMGANLTGKTLFGKNFKMPNFSKMFGGLKKVKLPNFSKMLGGLKKIKMPNFGKMFKGFNKKFKMPNFKKMFGGMKNPLDKLFGNKGHKVKLQADTKGLSKSISKLGKGKGTKVKLQADTKALGKSLSRLGKGKGQKVKLQADTKALSKSLGRLGKGKGQKIKLQADTRGLSKSISRLGKGKNTKIKVTADVSGAKSKINSLKNAVKSVSRGHNKIKITADTGGAKSKINSLKSAVRSLGNGSHKVRITCSVSGQGKVKSLKSAINGLHGKSVKISANASGVGKVQALKSAIDGVHSKKVRVSASVSGTGRVRALSSAINGVHSKHVKVSASVSGIDQVRALGSAIAAVHSKSVTVSATKVETTIKKTKSGSVAINPQQATQPVNPLTSMSVVAGNPSLAQALDASAANMGVDVNSAMNGQKVTDYSDSTQNVSEDYWRYMGNQLYTGLPLDEQVNKLEQSVTQADQDMDKLINLSRQRIDVDKKQIAYQQTMQNSYQQQVTDMINQLHGYGFNSDGNKITNLDHAKQITGDNASKVDDLLSKYQSAYQNMSDAAQKIEELRTDIWQQGKNQEDYRNTKDQKMVEKLQRELEILTTSIDNNKNILERQASSLSDGDYVMKMKNGSEQINDKTGAVYQLLEKFNRLSVANFVGTKDADNAKNLLESLQSIRDAVAENLDSIDELKKSMRDTTLNSIIENLDKYTTNLSDSIDRLKNNVENLQDGLLSGTTYSDLMSSDFDVVNLHQKSAYEKSVDERIDLEKAMDDALDRFAQKNVDRTARVANQELQINQQKYDSLYRMAEGYSNGQLMKIEPIRVKYEKQVETDQIDLPGVSHNQEYVKASTEYQKQMADLKAKYNAEMDKATSQEERELINQRMVYEQLSLQESTNKRMIAADKQAIEDLKKQAQDPGMSTEQLNTISDKVAEYEKNIIDAQNDIKDAVKGRFEFEKTQLDKEMDGYQRLADTMSNLVTIADALHLDGKTQAAVIDQQYAATYMQYDNYLNVLEKLRNEMGKYEKGSFERNQLQDMINDYQSSLDSTVTSLLDITKSEFEQTLDSVQKSFEESVNKGMTANQAKFDQDVWYNPMQKELKLEEMRLKITELEDKTVEKRIAALDAQERMSKAEADYVDKQLDLALAEQKLNNTINKKDVRYLEKDKNNKFNWTYIADQDQVDAARQEVNQAKQAIEDAKISNRNDYIEKAEEVIDNIKDGSINEKEARSRLEQLNNSYKFILKDIPTFDISKVEDIIKAYDEYEKKNNDILQDYHRSANVQNKAAYQDIVKGFGDQFKAVSKDLGEIFGKQLRDTLNLPNGIRNAYGTGKDQSFVVQNMTIELPEVKNADDFAKAIETLPQVAKQYATKK